MGKLQVSKTKRGYSVNGEVSIFEYEEDKIFYCVSPELDIIGYDFTAEGARKSFDTQIQAFFDYTTNKNCLPQELQRLGWSSSGNPEYVAPSHGALAASNDIYTELLDRQSYRKERQPVAYS